MSEGNFNPHMSASSGFDDTRAKRVHLDASDLPSDKTGSDSKYPTKSVVEVEDKKRIDKACFFSQRPFAIRTPVRETEDATERLRLEDVVQRARSYQDFQESLEMLDFEQAAGGLSSSDDIAKFTFEASAKRIDFLYRFERDLELKVLEKIIQLQSYDSRITRMKQSGELGAAFSALYSGLISRLTQIRCVKLEDASGFPSKQVLEEFKENIEPIARFCGIESLDELLQRIFAYGYSARKGSNYIDLIVDIAQRLIPESTEHATKLLNLALDLDPKCFRAMCEKWNIDYANLELLKNIIQLGKQLNRDVSKYEYALGERLGPARNLQHAVKLAYFFNRERLQREHPDAIVEYNTSLNEVHVLLPNNETLPQPEIHNVDHYSVKIVFLQNKVNLLVFMRTHFPNIFWRKFDNGQVKR